MKKKKEIKRKKENIKNKYIDYFRYTQTKEILSLETKKKMIKLIRMRIRNEKKSTK